MSVGPPYFEAVFAPLLLPAAWFMAMSPWSTWKSTSSFSLIKPLLFPLIAAVVVTAGFIVLRGKGSIMMALGIASATMLACATLMHVVQRVRQQGLGFGRLYALGLSYWAMVLAHLGVAVFIAGVTLVKTYEVEKDLVLSPGQTENFDGAMLRFDGVRMRTGENYGAWQGMFELKHANGSTVQLTPEKRRYMSNGQVMSEAAIDVGFFGDTYLSMGEPLPAEGNKPQAWTARIYSKPFINWIWWGCCMMAIGGVLSIFDRRYRNKVKLKDKSMPQEQVSQAAV